jgi:hypothetical protein
MSSLNTRIDEETHDNSSHVSHSHYAINLQFDAVFVLKWISTCFRKSYVAITGILKIYKKKKGGFDSALISNLL